MGRTSFFPRTAFPKRINHLLLSLASVLMLGGGAVAGVQLFGDPQAAAPKAIIPLRGGDGDAGPLRAPLSQVIVDPSIDGDAAFAAAEEEAAAPALPDIGEMAAVGGEVRIQTVESAPSAPKPLSKAPAPGLTAPGPMGSLPVIGPNGQTAFAAYRRPFVAQKDKPIIAVVVGGLGFNARVTEQAIKELPPEITLSFVPYAKDLQRWIDMARAHGHEALIELPMEPFDINANDTGPQTLLAAASASENIGRLENLLSRSVGYFAVMNYQGQKFAASPTASAPIAKALKERGLGLIGNGINSRAGLSREASKAGVPFASADRLLDIRQDAEAIDDQLLNLEALALENGAALGAGFAFPVTIAQVRTWAMDVHRRGYQLAPASAVMERRAAAR